MNRFKPHAIKCDEQTKGFLKKPKQTTFVAGTITNRKCFHALLKNVNSSRYNF